MRENMYAQSGQHSFYIDSQRDRTPSASNHRYQIGKLSTEETRSMLHETNRMLIARARHNAELVGNLVAAIDITKGNRGRAKPSVMRPTTSRRTGFSAAKTVKCTISGPPSRLSATTSRSYWTPFRSSAG